jgi:transposase-like protein
MTPGPPRQHESDQIVKRTSPRYTPRRVIGTAAISVEEVRAAHRAYIAGERRVAEIALGLRVSASTMKRCFRRLGLEIRPPGPKPLLLDGQVVREAHRAYIAGERPAAEVALGLGVSDGIMRRNFRRLGLQIRPPGGMPRPLNDEAARRAHRTYITGVHQLPEIASGLGVSPHTMRTHFRRLGLEIGPPGGVPRLLSDEAVRRAHRAYVARERPVAEIASELGVSPHTMRTHFRRLGLEVRQRSGIRCLPNDEEVRAAHRAYIAGERPVAEIALGLGFNDETMRTRFRGLGLDIRQPGRIPFLPTDEELRQAHRAYIAGERPVAEIALGLGVSAETMRRRFRQHGFDIR